MRPDRYYLLFSIIDSLLRIREMRRWKFHFVPHLAYLAAAACGFAAEPEDVEPPTKYTLIMDGKATDISEGKPLRLTGEFSNPEVSLRIDPHKIFPYAGLNFRYPRHFTFEADLADKDARTWTLSGAEAKIMIADLLGDVTLTAYAEAVSDNVGKGALEILDRKVKAKYGDQTLSGLRAKVTVGVVESSMDFYLISTASGRTRFLVLMDEYLDAGHTKEGAAAFALLKDSLVITRK